MKIVENKKFKTKITVNGKGELKTYIELIGVSMNNPPERGFSVEDMRERIKITDLLKKVTNEGKTNPKQVEFEDAHIPIIKDCLKGLRWGSLQPEIVEFTDYINEIA